MIKNIPDGHAIPHKPEQQGNVLFIILLGVFLFGALTFSVTQSSTDGGTGTLSEDKAVIYAGEILQYSSAIKEAIGRMQLMHNVQDFEISVDNLDSDLVLGTVNNTCTSDRCELFNPAGGAVKIRTLPEYYFDSTSQTFTDSNYYIRFYSASVPDIGSDKNELVLAIMGIHPDICKNINFKMSGIPTTTAIPNQSFASWTDFATTMTSFPEPSAAVSDALFQGKKTFCLAHATQKQVFIQVLLER